MDTTNINMPNLFMQLGLEHNANAIDEFIMNHSLASGIPLTEAQFWSESQKHFLQEALAQDAQWSEIIDQLDTLLRR